jgi:hypothetical protein
MSPAVSFVRRNSCGLLMTVIDAGIHLTEHHPQRPVCWPGTMRKPQSDFRRCSIGKLFRQLPTQDSPSSLKLRGAASTDTLVGSLRPGTAQPVSGTCDALPPISSISFVISSPPLAGLPAPL